MYRVFRMYSVYTEYVPRPLSTDRHIEYIPYRQNIFLVHIELMSYIQNVFRLIEYRICSDWINRRVLPSGSAIISRRATVRDNTYVVSLVHSLQIDT